MLYIKICPCDGCRWCCFFVCFCLFSMMVFCSVLQKTIWTIGEYLAPREAFFFSDIEYNIYNTYLVEHLCVIERPILGLILHRCWNCDTVVTHTAYTRTVNSTIYSCMCLSVQYNIIFMCVPEGQNMDVRVCR